MLIILRQRGKTEMIRCVLLWCWWKCGERESGSGIDLPCSMTPCYFSRLCGQSFRELVNGKWESERSGGEERKREMYRQWDWEEERQGRAAQRWLSRSFVLLLMLLIVASDVSHLCLRWVRHEKEQHAFNKMTCQARAVCLCFGARWWFWVIQPPTGYISTSGQNIFRHETRW